MSEPKTDGPARQPDGIRRPRLGLRYGGATAPRPQPHAGGAK